MKTEQAIVVAVVNCGLNLDDEMMNFDKLFMLCLDLIVFMVCQVGDYVLSDMQLKRVRVV